MLLTVTIQTYNNAELLDSTLEQLRGLQCPKADDYEILIVDNNSSDSTSKVIQKHIVASRSRMRSVFEPLQGLSHARNCALKKARGQVVCFLDDDVFVDPQWLTAVSTAFGRYSADVVGGRSYLIYPGQRPPWMTATTETLLSRLDHGDRTLVRTSKDLFGLNFAVRRSLAIALGGFRTDYGRSGKSLNCGEEIELLHRVRRAGGMVVYEPAAVVGHVVKPERLSRKWLLRRTYAGAVAAERMSMRNGKRDGVIRLLVHSGRCWASVAKSMLRGKDAPPVLFEKQYFAAYSLGRLAAAVQNRMALLRPLEKEPAWTA